MTAPRDAGPDERVLVVGAGFAGLYMLHKLREAGFDALGFEAGGDVGGTWFWNTYPGARCDIPSADYSYSFSDEIQREWSWSESHATQAELLGYARFVADKLDVRKHIRFNTRVVAAGFDEDDCVWRIVTDTGERFAGRWLVLATGSLSLANVPSLPGLETFEGEWHHTARWPADGVELDGKNIVLVGTGSTGVQLTPRLAAVARHLTVLQRTANYVLPGRVVPIDGDAMQAIRENYPQRRARARSLASGLAWLDPKPGRHLDDEQRRVVLKAAWGSDNAFGISRAFSDIITDPDINLFVSDFVRDKIRRIVADPATAEALVPRDHGIGTKRPCVGIGYYETFNRPNVRLVDLKRTPVEKVVPRGIRTADGTIHDADIIVLATGFDAITGAVLDIDIQGRDGLPLRAAWSEGARAYLGLSVPGFPNLFVINGPGSPAVFGNGILLGEIHVEWIVDLLENLRKRDLVLAEALAEPERDWTSHVAEVADATMMARAASWYTGANIPGKPRKFLPYLGGYVNYQNALGAEAASGYRGFRLGAIPANGGKGGGHDG